jgi:hypothetical protein
MNKNKKEQWADEVLHSLNKIERVEPSDNLFTKITERLSEKKQTKIIPIRHLQWLAVAACLLLGLNIFMFASNIVLTNKQVTNNKADYQLINAYSLYE